MPIIASAKKKLRKDRKRTEHNRPIKENIKQLVKATRRSQEAKTLPALFSALDKGVKTHIIHANKASRMKSRLSKLVAAAAAK